MLLNCGTLENPLDCKEIQPVTPKENQSWIFIGRTDVEAGTPILWPPDAKSWLIWKDLDAGKDWKAGREGDDRGWDGWMASLTQWTWVWVNSGSWWWTGVLQSMGSQKLDTTEWLNDMGRTHKHCEVQFCSLKNRQNQTNKTSYRIHCVALRIKWYTVE